MRFRLSVLMFLAYIPPACVVPLYSAHLADLGFGYATTGLCCATQALGVVLGVPLVSQIADRWLAANRCLILYSLLAAVCLVFLSVARDPVVVFFLTLLLWMLCSPIFLMTNTICFTLLPEAVRSFGGVRVFGTLGWMMAGWFVGLWLASPFWLAWLRELLAFLPWDYTLADSMRLGAIFALILAGYAMTIPHTPPKPNSNGELAPLAAYRLLRGRSFAAYCIGIIGVCITFPVTMQATPLLLRQLGITKEWLMPTLTLAQSTELLILPMLGSILGRLGFRGTMLLGLGAWAIALSILAIGHPVSLIVASQVLNGFCLTCFIIAGQVYVNQRAEPDLRASVQGILSFVNGFGQMLGHLSIGILREMYSGDLTASFGLAAIVGIALLPVFYFGFREPVTRATVPT